MAFAALFLLVCLGIGYFHFCTSPALRPLIDRVDPKTFYIAMVVKGFFLFCSSMLFIFIIHWLISLINCESNWFTYIRDTLLPAFQFPALSRETPFESKHFLPLVLPVLFVWCFNQWRPSSKELRTNQKYCIWKVSDTLERWFMEEAGLLIKETKGSTGPELSRLVLDNDKVYIGMILSPELDNGRITHVQIAPYYSGCLDIKDKSLVIVERYSVHYANEIRRLQKESPTSSDSSIASRLFLKFAVTIPVDRLVTVSSYSPNDREKLQEIKKNNQMFFESDHLAE